MPKSDTAIRANTLGEREEFPHTPPPSLLFFLRLSHHQRASSLILSYEYADVNTSPTTALRPPLTRQDRCPRRDGLQPQ